MSITIQRSFESTERYAFDFGACSYKNGWAQVDTKQDAPYYGTWTNPTTFKIFSYCEGDCTITNCDTPEEYCAEVRRLADWNKDNGYWKGIDAGFPGPLVDRFHALGLADLLH